MTWVKICGLTRPEDVEVAVAAGADALGFVLAPISVRRVTVGQAARLMADVPALRLLVTVDAEPDDVLAAVAATGADGVQPHGRHSGAAADAAAARGLFVLRPVAVSGTALRPEPQTIPADQIPILDTSHARLHGGTGRSFDWSAIVRPGRRFVLAGGLDADNVSEAVERVDPWGVDASSRLEMGPGIKDPAKVAAFIREAKRT
jgi:phosphoribosylanthranilate isomerase